MGCSRRLSDAGTASVEYPAKRRQEFGLQHWMRQPTSSDFPLESGQAGGSMARTAWRCTAMAALLTSRAPRRTAGRSGRAHQLGSQACSRDTTSGALQLEEDNHPGPELSEEHGVGTKSSPHQRGGHKVGCCRHARGGGSAACCLPASQPEPEAALGGQRPILLQQHSPAPGTAADDTCERGEGVHSCRPAGRHTVQAGDGALVSPWPRHGPPAASLGCQPLLKRQPLMK